MTGELLAGAFTGQALLGARDEVRGAALADGVAGPEVDRFGAAAARGISQLAGELTDGTFSPRPAVAVDIARGGGGVRRLAVPSVTDRIAGRALLAGLDDIDDCLEHVP